jgi:urease beta subunit
MGGFYGEGFYGSVSDSDWVKTLTVLSPLTNTDTIRVGDGSTSTPSIAFQGDADTGLYRAATASMHLIQGGVSGFCVTTEGAIGIGVDIVGAPGIGPGSVFIGNPSSVVAGAYLLCLADASTTAGYVPFQVYDDTLRINGVSGITAKDIVVYDGTGTTYPDDVLFTLDSSGRAYVQDGAAALPSYSFVNGATSGMYWDDANSRIGWSTATNERMYLSNDGFMLDVGVGPIDIDSSGAMSLNSSGGVINIGNENVAQNINIGTAGARPIVIGSAAAKGITIDTSEGLSFDALASSNFSITANSGSDMTLTLACSNAGAGKSYVSISAEEQILITCSAGDMLIDAGAAFEMNSSGGAISIGNDAVNQSINVGTGGTRTITLGNSAATVMVDTNLGIDTTTFGTSAASVLAIKNGTAPTTAPADTIQIFSVDSSDNTATLGLFLEQAVETKANLTLSQAIKVLVNGVEYWIGLDPV